MGLDFSSMCMIDLFSDTSHCISTERLFYTTTYTDTGTGIFPATSGKRSWDEIRKTQSTKFIKWGKENICCAIF